MFFGKHCKKNQDSKYDILDMLPDQVLASDMRDICYAALINDIVENNRSSQKLKKLFFYLVCGIFVFICVIGMVAIWNISRKAEIKIEDITVVLSAITGVLGSIIVLPTTIAKHLFPEDSEKERFSFIKGNRDSDVLLNEKSTQTPNQ